ncbi:hypothetical protein SDC9_88426 [bioreactor metagenome]|uniref:Uncharacterized protein n=1 Tax=bioreactor metagenome TaxID=1076179 RepID=A0A644ZM15_9ZZZZ
MQAGVRLLEDDRGPRLGGVLEQEVLGELQCGAGVGDVVGDQHLQAAQIVRLRARGEQDGCRETVVDPGVELDVHLGDLLDVEGVAERTTEGQPTPGDAHDDVGDEPVVDDHLGDLPDGDAETGIRQDLVLLAHADHPIPLLPGPAKVRGARRGAR